MEVEHAPTGFPYNSAKTLPRKAGDMDYNDVFGGPPRRFSMQEVRGRYGLGGTVIEEEEEEVDRVSTPVFGEEATPRRRNLGGNFFDDIFGGDENYVSPRNRDRNSVFGSNPSSTSISPTKPKSEQFGTSPTAKFSPPAIFNKVELPAFAHGQFKLEISTNALISPRGSTPLSRFSSEAIRSQDEIRNVARLQRQSSLPRETWFRHEDMPNAVTSPTLKKDRRSFDGNSNHFYNSIYKWASSKGLPMINLMCRNSPKSKDGVGKCASFNGRTESKPSFRSNGGLFVHTEPEHLKMGFEKDSRCKDQGIKERENSVEPYVLGVENVSGFAKQNTKLERRKSAEFRIKERIVKQVHVGMNESPRSEVMPTLRKLLIAESELKGLFENKTTTPRKDHSDLGECSNKNEGTWVDEDYKSSLQAETLAVNSGKSVTAGKVKEMVQIFDQEADPRRKEDAYERSESHRWKATGTDGKENVNESLKKDERQQHPQIKKIPNAESDNISANHDTVSLSESVLWDSTSLENLDKSLDDNFMVEQLFNDTEEVAQGSEALEDFKATDEKIQQWSVGKEGNIRSLLSTLQYVLWPGSGWNPIPLVELIEANSVKRAYQKALLRLHPDKLQQNSAASLHRYTAEKIFDILQEAWDHFNSLAPL